VVLWCSYPMRWCVRGVVTPRDGAAVLAGDTHCLFGRMITFPWRARWRGMGRIQTSLLLFRNLLDRQEPVLSHLDPFRHVTDSGVLCGGSNIPLHRSHKYNVRFEVFTAVTMNNVVFWDIKPQVVLNRRHITSPLQCPTS
jgi:hypothetical protein